MTRPISQWTRDSRRAPSLEGRTSATLPSSERTTCTTGYTLLSMVSCFLWRYSRRVSTTKGRSRTLVRITVTGAYHPSLSTSGLTTSTSTRSGLDRSRNSKVAFTRWARVSGLRPFRKEGGAFEKKISAKETRASTWLPLA